MSRPSKIIYSVPIMAAFLLFLVGCGEPVGEVSGKVTFKGAPVTVGSISFHMKSKGIAQDAKLDSAGKFTMPVAMPAGTYQAYYVPPTPEPQDPSKGPAPTAVKTDVPKKYQDLKTSDLSFDIKGGKNDVHVEMKE